MKGKVQGLRSKVKGLAHGAAWGMLWIIIGVMLARLLDIAWETARYALELWVHTPDF